MVNIVGYEFDIVRPDNLSSPCVSSSFTNPIRCNSTSVPSYQQYNHHYANILYGGGTKQVTTGIPSFNPGMAGHAARGVQEGYAEITDEETLVATRPNPNPGPDPDRAGSGLLEAPTSQWPLMGNGAEARLTLKYFPRGYGALLASPTYTSIVPMIIDTNARGKTSSTPGRHGPVPPQANVGPEAMYSGIMECPCTDAFPKSVASATTLQAGTCPASSAVLTADECFESAVSLGLHAKINSTVDTDAAPPGCSATAISGGFDVAFNSNPKSTRECGGSGTDRYTNRRVSMMETGACDVCSLSIDIQPTVMPKSVDIAGEWIIGGLLNAGTLVTVTRDTTGPLNVYGSVCNGPACGPTGWEYLVTLTLTPTPTPTPKPQP